MIIKSMLITGLAASFLLTACENDKGAGPTNGKSALLTGAKWKISSHTVTPGVDEGDGILVTNLMTPDAACVHDDFTQYTANGKWSVDEGATKCDASDPQIETGTWKFNAAGDSLTITSDLDAVSLHGKIESLTASQLRLSLVGDWDDDIDHIETMTFSAQ